MTEARQTIQRKAGPAAPHERVWVLDDPRGGNAAQAIGIGERLGVAVRRVPLAWNWMGHAAGFGRNGSLIGLSASARRLLAPASSPLDEAGWNTADARGPELVISAGRRSAAVALWLKGRYGSRVVHCSTPGPGLAGDLGLGFSEMTLGGSRAENFDLLVMPAHDRPPLADNVMTVLGAPHRLSPLLLHQQGEAWAERLGHLPHPRVALLLGGRRHGSDMPPALAHGLARKVARLAARHGGAVLASTSRRTGPEATEALAAGLSPVLHLLYRWGEPGPNPYRGFLATADVIVVTADSISMISEACATDAAVYVALPELAGPRQRRLLTNLYDVGQARKFDNDLAVWPRASLDEAGRVASEIRRRFPLD